MLYTVEQYDALVRADDRYRRLSGGIVPDKVSMAVALASTAPGKSAVGFARFADFAASAQACGCLTVYVDIYGRAVSYVITACCTFDEGSADPVIWMADDPDCASLLIVDACFTEGSLSQSVALFLSSTRAASITLYRADRPRQYRRYGIDRIRRRTWPRSYVHDRFSPANHRYVDEYVRSSFALMDLAARACSVLRLVDAQEDAADLTVGQSFPLVAGLLNLDQIRFTQADGGAAAIGYALSWHDRWHGGTVGGYLARPLEDFADGDDIVILFGVGDTALVADALRTLIRRLIGEDEPDVFIQQVLYRRFEGVVGEEYANAGWQVSVAVQDGLARITRHGG